MKGIAWGRLLRLSLAPSAAADALAGITIGAWGAFPLDPRVLLAAVGSLCVFHGGMALNDWADRAGDARTRPDRPIPSGAVSARSALRAAVTLLLLGPLLTACASPLAGACLAAVALTAALYDVAGRGPWLGPTLLGLCRGGNLAAGVLAGTVLSGGGLERFPHWALIVCALYGLYVFSASRLARLEDDEDAENLDGRPTRALLAATVCLAASPFAVFVARGPRFLSDVDAREEVPQIGWALLSAPWFVAPVVALVSAYGLARVTKDGEPWTRERVGRAAGMSLRRLLVFTSVCAWCAPIAAARAHVAATGPAYAAYVVAPALLLGYPIALRLRRVFPPT